MADAANMRTLLSGLINNNEKFVIVVENLFYNDMILGDTTDPSYFRMIIKWNEAGIMPSQGKIPYKLPIGLVQVNVPYEDIHYVARFNIEKQLYDKIPESVRNWYNHLNVEEGYDVSQQYIPKDEKKTP